MTTLWDVRREKRQANPTVAAPKVPGRSVLTIKAGMSFCFMGIMLATPPPIKDSDCDPRGDAARPDP